MARHRTFDELLKAAFEAGARRGAHHSALGFEEWRATIADGELEPEDSAPSFTGDPTSVRDVAAHVEDVLRRRQEGAFIGLTHPPRLA